MYRLLLILILFIPLTVTPAPTDPAVTMFVLTAPTVDLKGRPLTDLAGYKIYCRTGDANYPPQGHDVPDPNITKYPISEVVNLSVDAAYTCVSAAYTNLGHEGVYSIEQHFLVSGGITERDIAVPAAPGFKLE